MAGRLVWHPHPTQGGLDARHEIQARDRCRRGSGRGERRGDRQRRHIVIGDAVGVVDGQPPAQHDPSKGGHTANGKTEKLLTGDVAAKVKAAALAKVSGTVERVETNVDSSAPYEAHIRKADGTEVEVQVSKDYSVAAVNTMGRHR